MAVEERTRRHTVSTVSWLKDIQFKKNSVKMTDISNQKFQIPYDVIVMAYIENEDKKTGEIHRLEFTDLTEEADGEVILYDCHHCQFRLRVEGTGRKAGYILKQLALHAPYIMMDSGGWLEEDDEMEFAEAEWMVSLRREL